MRHRPVLLLALLRAAAQVGHSICCPLAGRPGDRTRCPRLPRRPPNRLETSINTPQRTTSNRVAEERRNTTHATCHHHHKVRNREEIRSTEGHPRRIELRRRKHP